MALTFVILVLSYREPGGYEFCYIVSVLQGTR